jgi:hypothetical protein
LAGTPRAAKQPRPASASDKPAAGPAAEEHDLRHGPGPQERRGALEPLAVGRRDLAVQPEPHPEDEGAPVAAVDLSPGAARGAEDRQVRRREAGAQRRGYDGQRHRQCREPLDADHRRVARVAALAGGRTIPLPWYRRFFHFHAPIG